MSNNLKSAARFGPREVFLHFLAFGTLYASVIGLLTLWFQYIDYLLPDPLTFYYRQIFDQIRRASAILLVVFPVFLLVSRVLEKDFTAEPAKKENRFRKWLVYFTLFVAAVTLIVDLIILIFNFYGGELTRPFAFKVLAVFLAAGGVGGYYFLDVKNYRKNYWFKPVAWAVLAVAVVVVSLVSGFFVVGSPAKQRQIRFDEQRVENLQAMQSQIINYWTQKNRLPAILDDLRDNISGFIPPRDPETKAVYEYRILDDLNFKLCATFNAPSRWNFSPGQKDGRLFSGGIYEEENWEHQAGSFCFTRSIDPELYHSPESLPKPYSR